MHDERTQAALLLAIGAMAIRLGVTDAGLAYLRPTMQPVLATAGVIVVGFGLAQLVQWLRQRRGRDDRALDHHEHRGMAAAWLLLAPVLALLLIAPPPLGSFAAERQGTGPVADTGVDFEPLPEPTDGAVELSLREYTTRALYDPDATLEGQRVRLTGFVTSDPDGDGDYRLTRFVISCCAADATAVSVRVLDDEPRPPDSWVTVEGEWDPADGGGTDDGDEQLPRLRVQQAQAIEQPAEPYEY